MNKVTIMTEAHIIARKSMKVGDNYKVNFSAALKIAHAQNKLKVTSFKTAKGATVEIKTQEINYEIETIEGLDIVTFVDKIKLIQMSIAGRIYNERKIRLTTYKGIKCIQFGTQGNSP